MKNDLLKRFLPFLALILPCYSLAETQQNSKQWNGIFLTGPLTDAKTFLYYLDAQLRLINRSDIFDQAIANLGIGYQYQANLSFWLGNSWVITNDIIEDPNHEYRIWQQALWDPIKQATYSVTTRSRLEQRKDLEQSDWALRLRHKDSLNIPLTHFKNNILVIANEIFFNLNHPEWITNKVLDQNRASIGIAFPLSQQTTLEVGYLNQFLFRNPNEMYHVAYINLRLNSNSR